MQAGVAQELELRGETVTIWPAGVEANARDIAAILLTETRQSVFRERSRVLDHDEMEIMFSSRSDDEGIVAPLERARGGPGDLFIIDGSTWYLKQLLEDGRRGGGLHRVLLSSSPNPNA